MNCIRGAWAAGMLLMCVIGLAEAQQAEQRTLAHRVNERLAGAEGSLTELRHDIHQHPEISGQEERTAGVVAERLRARGFEVRTGVGGHGVVGVLRGGSPGPTIAFRADMDAMPSDAPDPVEYRSLRPGVRHICGHDVHVTVGLGIAEGLAAVRDELAGTLILVFQPAEERGTGARAMLADGVFASIHPDAIYAMHTAPYPVGIVGTAPGPMMAGRDVVQVTLRGSGDLTAAAASIRLAIEAVSTIPPAQVLQPAPPDFILTQVFPGQPTDTESVTVRAQITTASADARARAKAAIVRGVEELTFPDVTVETVYQDRVLAGVTNDADLVSRADQSIRAWLGEEAVVAVEGVPPVFSEDFGFFQDGIPGVMYFLGVSNPDKGTVGMPHSPDYVADDGAILVGARAMSAVILDWLVEQGSERR
jgi:metal-dependent amidase/aminoacylase/carboxypeptidase family protein